MFKFMYNEYEKFIKFMQKYGVYRFCDINNQISKGIILRHDVDYELSNAYNLYLLEKELNIKSTYFIMVTSPNYNVLEYKNKKMLKEICLNGYEIGLHFDPLCYEGDKIEYLINKVKLECGILEGIIDNKVKSISLHSPSVYNTYYNFDGYNNAYDKAYFNPEFYLSDSCKDFRGKDPYEFINLADKHLIQVLMHPIHFNESELNYVETVANICINKVNNIHELMLLNRAYRNQSIDINMYKVINNKIDGILKKVD